MKRAALLILLLGAPLPALGQSSASFQLDEHVLNAGGRPAGGTVSTSVSFTMSLDSIGDGLAGRALSSASFRMDGGFAAAYPPPGEVLGLRLLPDHQSLIWSHEPASTAYNVYKATISTLPGGAYGQCAVSRVPGNTWADNATPVSSGGFFYLVTGENRLWDEGTKGHASSGVERANLSPCP